MQKNELPNKSSVVIFSFRKTIVVIASKPAPTPGPFPCYSFSPKHFFPQKYESLTLHFIQVSVQMLSEEVSLIL